MKTDDTIRLPHKWGYRVWRVIAIELGSTREENIIGLEALDRESNGEIRVPEDILMAAMELQG